jgi:hypothetical protein
LAFNLCSTFGNCSQTRSRRARARSHAPRSKFYREEPPWRKYLDRSLPADRWQWDLPEASVADGAARRDVAWLLLHSMQDPWVDVSQSHQFADALRRGGAQRVMLSLAAEGGAHDEALRRIGDAENDWTRSLLSFVDSVTARV